MEKETTSREVLSQKEFEQMVLDEMYNDDCAGGDPATSRARAERWAHSEYHTAE